MVNLMSADLNQLNMNLKNQLLLLRKAGIRTPQRQAIIYLISSHSHPTAMKFYQALSPDFS